MDNQRERKGNANQTNSRDRKHNTEENKPDLQTNGKKVGNEEIEK